MAKNKRWGKIFIDKRDWKVYQKELGQRYEIYLDLFRFQKLKIYKYSKYAYFSMNSNISTH